MKVFEVGSCQEIWPSALDLPLDSEEFNQRVRVLQLMGSGVRNTGAAPTLSLALFDTLANSVVATDENRTCHRKIR